MYGCFIKFYKSTKGNADTTYSAQNSITPTPRRHTDTTTTSRKANTTEHRTEHHPNHHHRTKCCIEINNKIESNFQYAVRRRKVNWMFPIQPKETDFYKYQTRADHDTFVYDGVAPMGEWQAVRAAFAAWYHDDGGRLHSGVHYTSVVAMYHRYVIGICDDMLRIAERAPHWQSMTEHTHRWCVWMGRQLRTECNC